MKHIQLFEQYNTGTPAPGGGEKTKIKLYLEGSNPDVNYSGTVVGVGNTPREAAMYCIMAAVTLMKSGDTAPAPQDLNNFKGVVEDFILEEELEEVLNLLERGEVLTDNFGYSFLSGSDYIKAEASIEKALPSADIGGFILSYHFGEVEIESDDDTDWYPS